MDEKRDTSNSLSLKEAILAASTEESRKKALLFQPRPSDIIIATSPKCGTTWIQQIIHQLRTGGDTDFANIALEVPWIESAHDNKLDIDANQKGTPRAYKCHFAYNDCPKGCKYIVICRDPCAVVYSLYKFLEGVTFKRETVNIKNFVAETWLAFSDPVNKDKKNESDVSYFAHLLSWFEHRNDPNVLMLFFEELKEDLEKVVRVVGEFIGVQDEGKIRTAVEMSSFSFMKANAEKFDVSVVKKPPEKPLLFHIMRSGSANEGREVLSDDVKAIIQQRWEEVITKVTGYKTYQELRRGVRNERPLW